MTLFEEIVAEVLCENIAPGTINDAIDRTYEVKINYSSGGEGKATGERIIQPVAYGISKAGNLVVRAFQPYGDTKTKTPAWKFFRVDRILSWKPLRKRVFKNRPPDGFDAEGLFNDNGDKLMSTVYNIAVFGDKQMGTQTTGPVTKLNISGNKLDFVPNKMDIMGNNDNTKDTITNLDGPVTASDIFKTQTEKDIESRRRQMNKNEKVPQSVIDAWNKENGKEDKKSESGPVEVSNQFKTQTEKDIESRRRQLNKNERVPQSVLDAWNKENGKVNETQSEGPITKSDVFKTQTERDIESRRKQLNKNERIPQNIIDDWERRKKDREGKKKRYADNNIRFKSGISKG